MRRVNTCPPSCGYCTFISAVAISIPNQHLDLCLDLCLHQPVLCFPASQTAPWHFCVASAICGTNRVGPPANARVAFPQMLSRATAEISSLVCSPFCCLSTAECLRNHSHSVCYMALTVSCLPPSRMDQGPAGRTLCAQLPIGQRRGKMGREGQAHVEGGPPEVCRDHGRRRGPDR